jgi:hypothetical protein
VAKRILPGEVDMGRSFESVRVEPKSLGQMPKASRA